MERERIEIELNEEARELTILGGGGESTREHAITKRVKLRREEERARFSEVFFIPGTVDLGGIDAEYDKRHEILTVHLPKLALRAIEETEREREAEEEEPGEQEEEEEGETRKGGEVRRSRRESLVRTPMLLGGSALFFALVAIAFRILCKRRRRAA